MTDLYAIMAIVRRLQAAVKMKHNTFCLVVNAETGPDRLDAYQDYIRHMATVTTLLETLHIATRDSSALYDGEMQALDINIECWERAERLRKVAS